MGIRFLLVGSPDGGRQSDGGWGWGPLKPGVSSMGTQAFHSRSSELLVAIQEERSRGSGPVVCALLRGISACAACTFPQHHVLHSTE